MPTQQRTCNPSAHDFVPKKQRTAVIGTDQVMDISEVYCRKCGTVCFLTQREPEEPSRIALAHATN
jgi:hypothetical protein